MRQRIVLATGNQGKVFELNGMLESVGINVIAQTELAVSEIVENGLTFVENALLKARNAAKCTGLPAIADDSGLEVDALKGAPGIYSARFAGPDAGDVDNNMKLLAELEGVADAQRSARFQCVLVYLRHEHDPVPLICQGSWEGSILHTPQGENGFGYDPLFYIKASGRSAAQLSAEQKSRLSHRGQALRQLVDVLELQEKR
ncbi:MAG: RdgB/HAM1 family non-canonical purine NTP pyrophosphatase [Gammaproteobacteria bacterium]|nr:RdgB/HAM1 family non-canonical purine NTP pyrophosphatase [Gammaproteobacteria bacterium]MCF6230030.1 RdgB/HAM1 family non-canonical purine NTP pyrophosphatase [Gammaproteobacteria bacterium]